MNYEAWIWTELLAFDNTAPDLGVEEYLERLGYIPTGISIMASAIDFVLLHEPLNKERPLFWDVCTRFGHAGNEERARQDWTNFQLRDLIARLKTHGIEIFLSVFASYQRDKFHHEWLTDHQEAKIVYSHMGVTDGLEPICRLNDGTKFEDIYAPKLLETIQDYGFTGWHGADGMGPAGSLGFSDCSDGMVAMFADFLGDKLPAEMELDTNHEVPRLTRRMEFIWAKLHREWIDFNMLRWEEFWCGVTDTLHPHGIQTMINSANTKAAFESMYHQGMDYRRIMAMGVDYMVVEAVAANLAIISGGHERHFDFATTLAEMKALLPEMKIIFLHGVKDVAESYDLLRHAPGRLEREFYTLSNQYQRLADGQLERCATGFMVCLGDGLPKHDWTYLQQQWETGYSFKPMKNGGLTWLWSETTEDNMLMDYREHGTWPGFRQTAHLTEWYGLQISEICRLENIGQAVGPVIVPNANLLTPEEMAAIFDYKAGPVVLIGSLAGHEACVMRADTASVTCQISETYLLSCMVLDTTVAGQYIELPAVTDKAFKDSRPPLAFWDRADFMPIPEEFWAKSAELIRQSLENWQQANDILDCHTHNLAEGLRIMTCENAEGVLRTAVISCIPTYLCPDFSFTKPPLTAQKISSFPYTPLTVVDVAIRSGHNFTPLHIPPYGIIVMDITTEK